MKLSIKFKLLQYLFYCPPLFALLAYFVVGEQGTNTVFMVCNVVGTVLLVSMIPGRRDKIIAILYCLYFVLGLCLYPTIKGNKMYMSSVLYTMIILLFFSNLKNISAYKNICSQLDKQFIKFACVLIIGQLLTIDNPLSFLRFNYNSIEEDALEQKGFLISHAFGYYLAIFVTYFAYKRKLFLMIVFTLLCFFLTRRTCVLLCSIGWLYYIYTCYGRLRLFIILAILIIVLFFYLDTLSYFGNFSFSLDPSDKESRVFSNGRVLFWGSYIAYIQSGAMNFYEYLLGFGPASSAIFNKMYAGIEVWMHNDFFDIAYCLGIVGLILYFTVFIKAARALGVIFSFFVLLAANVNGFMLYQTYPIVFIFAIIKQLQDNTLKPVSSKLH